MGVRSSRPRRGAFLGPAGALLPAVWTLALLCACQPTKGHNPDAFRQAATTNFDFTQAQVIPTGMQPVSVAVAAGPQVTGPQMTQCPIPNAAVANFIDSTVTFLTNNGGTGNFMTPIPPQTIATGLAPVQIKFADLKDSLTAPSTPANCAFDMVVMLEQNTVGIGNGFTVLLNNNNLSWTPQTIPIPSGNPPAQFELMDMNNDGYIDIVASVPGDSAMEIYYNDGAAQPGTFNPTPVAVPLSGEPGRFAVRDNVGNPLLDAGGCPYMAAVVPSPNHVDVAFNNGSCGSSYTFVSYGTDADPVDIVAANLSGGTLPDLLVLTNFPRMNVYLNQGSPGAFAQNTNGNQDVRTSPSRMYVRNFDGINPESVIAFPSNNALQTIKYPAGAGGSGGLMLTYDMWDYDLTPTPFDVAIGSFTGSSCSANGDIAVPASGTFRGSRVLFIGANDCLGNFSFTQIGFPDTPGEPAVARLQGAGTAQDMLVPFKLDNFVLYLKNNHG